MTTPSEFFDTYCRAVGSIDPATLLELYADDARVFDAMEPEEYADKEAWAGQVEQWFGALSEGRAEVRDAQVVESDDLALLTGHVRYSGTLSVGEEADVECRFSVVLERAGDDWLIVHEHSSVPVEMEDDEDEDDE